MKLKNIFLSFTIIVGIGSFLVSVPQVGAVDSVLKSACNNKNNKDAANSALCEQANPSGNNDKFNKVIENITNTLLFAIGIISVIMIIVGGLKYTTSDGDPAKAKSAKNTVLYAVVGLVIAVLAYAIVQFVMTQLTKV